MEASCSRSHDFSRSPRRREREVRPRAECQGGEPSAQRHKDRPTDETEVANSVNVNSGIVNYELGTPSWGQKLLEYQLRSEKRLEELENFCQK